MSSVLKIHTAHSTQSANGGTIKAELDTLISTESWRKRLDKRRMYWLRELDHLKAAVNGLTVAPSPMLRRELILACEFFGLKARDAEQVPHGDLGEWLAVEIAQRCSLEGYKIYIERRLVEQKSHHESTLVGSMAYYLQEFEMHRFAYAAGAKDMLMSFDDTMRLMRPRALEVMATKLSWDERADGTPEALVRHFPMDLLDTLSNFGRDAFTEDQSPEHVTDYLLRDHPRAMVQAGLCVARWALEEREASHVRSPRTRFAGTGIPNPNGDPWHGHMPSPVEIVDSIARKISMIREGFAGFEIQQSAGLMDGNGRNSVIVRVQDNDFLIDIRGLYTTLTRAMVLEIEAERAQHQAQHAFAVVGDALTMAARKAVSGTAVQLVDEVALYESVAALLP
ncbi:MAG: hypothetical protein IV113_05875 [Hydrogenophaga sp.]|nr:hypothetical protein [Hydrogenophaga sp.]